MELRFDTSELQHWAARYSSDDDAHLIEQVGPTVQRRGHLTKADLVVICEWKSPRIRPRVQRNEATLVEEVTRVSLSSAHEQFKVEVLQLLQGVGWPTASVILHFCAREPYPILDFRALWSLGYASPPSYTFEFWWQYVTYVRHLATVTSLGMRTIDQALWQYSSERQ